MIDRKWIGHAMKTSVLTVDRTRLQFFAKAIGEFGATITFVSNIPGETQTISSAIYSLIQTPDGDAAASRLVIISISIAVVALILSEWFARRATQRLHGN